MDDSATKRAVMPADRSSGRPRSASAGRNAGWPPWLWAMLLAVALILTIRSDRACLHWASALSTQGSPPPPQDPHSPTGYALGQRQFLGTHRRGETYRWIAATQDLIASGPLASRAYHADNVPHGRPQLLPRLYAGWVAAIAGALHLLTGQPLAIAVEQAALWEPVISHALAFLAVVMFMWVRHGPTAAGVAGACFALFPPLFGQFLPGALTAETWALFLAAYAIACNLPRPGAGQIPRACSMASAVAAGLAIWLDPGFGVPAVLITAAAGVAVMLTQDAKVPCLRWALVGSGLTLIAWLVDGGRWDPTAGELRFVHPVYALAWLGIGVGMAAYQEIHSGQRHRRLYLAAIAVAAALLAPLVYAQLSHGYKGWWYTSASMRRLTSLDETTVFNNIADWLARTSVAEVMLVSAPVLIATAALAGFLLRRPDTRRKLPASLAVSAVVCAGLLVLIVFKVRWMVIASLVALPVVATLAAGASRALRRGLLAGAVVFLFALFAWNRTLPASLRRPAAETPPGPADLQALIYRQFAHWLASHNPGQDVSVLAPPELSDAIVFHGGGRVLMSTAWESYPGQVAASRVLSASESTEAEAVLQNLALTHVILASWDEVLPLLVQKPEGAGGDTLYARLQRWVLPRYLRPIPYHLPPVPGFIDQKLAVLKVTPPQDEALALSRLAEYFVEMDRPEPAGLAAKVLAESFPDDPNAAIARATVYAQSGNQPGFEHELERLAADATAGKVPFSWDRRVQRAIVLALGHRHARARGEIEACIAATSEADLFDLTPLQAYRLRVLADEYGVAFPDAKLPALLRSLGAEYSAVPAVPAPR